MERFKGELRNEAREVPRGALNRSTRVPIEYPSGTHISFAGVGEIQISASKLKPQLPENKPSTAKQRGCIAGVILKISLLGLR